MTNKYPKFGDEVDYQLYDFDAHQKVCKQHIDNVFFINYISEKGELGKCSYCNKNLKVVDLSEILELIVVGIDYLYEDPVNSRYLNKDGKHGYDGNTFGFYELWEDFALEITKDELSEDIYQYLENDSIYCEKNEYTSEEEYLGELWNLFKHTVKHKARFVFYFEKIFSNYLFTDPIAILSQVQNSILALNLLMQIPAGTRLYRCRQHTLDTPVKEAKDMASAPQEYSKANGRMNPAGISMFYSSQHKDLTIKEVVNFTDSTKSYYSTAIFYTQENLKLVDLTNIPKSPSIFDEVNNRYIDELAFLNSFIDDITKPIHENDSIIEYIPTQIVTEYIRFNPELNVDGIIYPSSKDGNFNNIVLFYNHEESQEKLRYSKRSLKRYSI
jgi:hypothetical protein